MWKPAIQVHQRRAIVRIRRCAPEVARDPLLDHPQPILDREQCKVIPDLRSRLPDLLSETLHPHPARSSAGRQYANLNAGLRVAFDVVSSLAHDVHRRVEVERARRRVSPRVRGHLVRRCAHDATLCIERRARRRCTVRVLGEHERVWLLPDEQLIDLARRGAPQQVRHLQRASVM